MEWFWEVLNLAETTEITVVKKAYVERVRFYKNQQTKEEVSQETFQRLSEAEQAAVLFIETAQRQRRNVLPEDSKQIPNVSKALQSETSQPISTIEGAIHLEAKKIMRKQAVELGTEEVKRLQKVAEIEAKIARAEVGNQAKTQLEEAKQKNILLTNAARQATTQHEMESQVEAVKKKEKRSQKMNQKNQQVTQQAEANKKAAVTSGTSHSPAAQVSPAYVAKVKQLTELLEQWPDCVELKNWQLIFTDDQKTTLAERHYLEREFLPRFALELPYLPKPILTYLYEKLSLRKIDEGQEYYWFKQIDGLPDFSFEWAYYLPEYEHHEYFEQRFRLYQLLLQENWSSHRLEIENLYQALRDLLMELIDETAIDQDVANLNGIYLSLTHQEEMVPHHGTSWNLLDHFQLSQVPITEQHNQTTKFLQLVFETMARKNISNSESLLIETAKTTYVPENLAKFLAGLAFYQAGNKVKAVGYFSQLDSHSQQLIKPLDQKGLPLTPIASSKRQTATHDLKPMTIIRIGIMIIVGLGLIGNIFSDNSAYDDDYDWIIDEEEYDWGDDEEEYEDYAVYGDELLTDFTNLFLTNTENGNWEQEEFIEYYVTDEMTERFKRHVSEFGAEDSSYLAENLESFSRYIEREDGSACWYYLFSAEKELVLILTVENESVTNVQGPGWDETNREEIVKLAETIKVQPAELNRVLVEDYLLVLDEDPYLDQDDYADLFNPEATEIAYELLELEEIDKLAGGSYRLSQAEQGAQLLLYFSEQDQLIMYFELDEFGRFISAQNYTKDDVSWQLTDVLKTATPAVEITEGR